MLFKLVSHAEEIVFSPTPRSLRASHISIEVVILFQLEFHVFLQLVVLGEHVICFFLKVLSAHDCVLLHSNLTAHALGLA